MLAIRLASVSPGGNSDRLIELPPPITCVTAIASPNARPSPSSTAAEMPGAAYGIATLRIASQRVEPRASEPSERSRGTRLNSSRQIAEVIGMIMIVSTSAAGSTPDWDGSPEKIGRKPNQLWSHGSRCCATQGPKTRMPQSPSTTLGIAASSSTIVAIGAASRFGASSVRNSAIAIESGVASSRAMNDVTSVP